MSPSIEALEASSRLPLGEGAEILAENGVILARGLYPRDWILTLGALVEETYVTLARAYELGRMPLKDRGIFESRAFYLSLLELDGETVASRLAAPVERLAESVLGGPVTTDLLSFVRRVEPGDVEVGPAHRLPFHQDEKILNVTLLNLWVPFRDCGVVAPGLEVVARHLSQIERNEAHDRNKYGKMGAEIPAEWVVQTYGDALVAPEMKAGDALIFFGGTIHRTHITPGMTERRDSVDLRLVRATA